MDKLKTENDIKFVECSDWDAFVMKAYSRPYCFQQQDGCMQRGIYRFSVPSDYEDEEDEMNDSIPEVINGDEIGVKFKTWLEKDPLEVDDFGLFWERSFYPNLETLANDMHEKGLIEAGEYCIIVDW